MPSASASAVGEVTARRVFITTLLNPKGLIIGLALLPRGADPEFVPRLGLLALSIIGVALVWAAAGTLLRRHEGEPPLIYRRAAGGWLAFLAAALERFMF